MSLSSINIDRDKLSILQSLSEKEKNLDPAILLDNILAEWLLKYNDEIKDTLGKK
jgi:hypothetical protein